MDELHAVAAQALDAQRSLIAEIAVAAQFAQQPALAARYGPAGRLRCLEDAAYHLRYLSQAVRVAAPALFVDYIRWAAVMLTSRGIPVQDLAASLAQLQTAVKAQLPAETGGLVSTYLDAGIAAVVESPATVPTVLVPSGPLAPLAQRYLGALLRYDRTEASRLIQEAVASGVPIPDLYLDLFQRVQREVGRLWQLNRVSVAQEHYCTAATQLIMAQLYPALFRGERGRQRVVTTCIVGDLHELGMRMVADILELHGWESLYLGANTPTSAIIQTLREEPAQALAISATMPFHVQAVADLIAAVRTALPGTRLPILVGGYAFQRVPDLWQQVGADGYADDAADAVRCLNELTGGGPGA